MITVKQQVMRFFQIMHYKVCSHTDEDIVEGKILCPLFRITESATL